LHGLGFGGEWATGAVLMGEVIRDKYRGRSPVSGDTHDYTAMATPSEH